MRCKYSADFDFYRSNLLLKIRVCRAPSRLQDVFRYSSYFMSFLPVLVTVRHLFVYQSLALETFVPTATLSCGLPIGIYWIIWFYSARLTWCCQPNSYNTSGGHCVVRGRSRPKSVVGSPS